MARVLVRSRSGNVMLAVLGAIYALSAIVVLVAFAVDVWNAAAITDLALQVCLAASAVCGVWFLHIARENLGIRGGRGPTPLRSRTPQAR